MAGERRTETLIPVARAGFHDETDSIFDPTTKRVSTRALVELIAATVDPDSPTHVPAGPRPPPLRSRADRVLAELQAMRSGPSVAEPFGRYTLLGSVGKGGMAEVRLAAEPFAGAIRLCVVKRTISTGPKVEHRRALLREEARVCRRLAHPNVVELLDAGEIDGAPYLVFELIDGVSLRELMEIVRPGRIPLSGVLEIGRSCASALAHAHRAAGDDGRPLAVVHRDVTPQNILVARDGRVKLVDFGIARFEGRAHETRAGHVKGKLGYMAPEQCRPGPVDGKADVFTLGLVLTELIAGERVLPPVMMVLSETEALIRSRAALAQEPVPTGFIDLLVRMVELAPDRRPTAGEVEAEIAELGGSGGAGETLAAFVAREVFARLEPFDRSIAIDPPAAPPPEDPTLEPTDPSDSSYARTVRQLRSLSGPPDDAATRRLPALPALERPAPAAPAPASEPGRAVFFFVLFAALMGFIALVFVLTR